MIQSRKGKSLLQLINQKTFVSLCEKWGADCRVRSFSCWEMTCTHIMAFLLRLKTLREIELSLLVPRSTLSDANTNRPAGFYEELCKSVITEIAGATGSGKVRRAIKALDSTECCVHGSMSSLPLWKTGSADWKKATAKLHVLWDVGGKWVGDFRITGKGSADNVVGRWFEITANCTYVFDRGYTDIDFWWKIISHKSHFVTRLKKYPVYERLLERVVAKDPEATGVLWDGKWLPTQSLRSRHPQLPAGFSLRHIIYKDPESKKLFHFITSDRRSSAQTIADIYKKRWAVELLFRWFKGNLRMRYLAAKSPNAIRIQLAICVLIQLLIRLAQLKSRCSSTASEYLRTIRVALFRQTVERSCLTRYGRWKAATVFTPGGI